MSKRINFILEKGFRYLEFFYIRVLIHEYVRILYVKKVQGYTASRIQTMVSKYADTDVFDYLRGVAHNFQLQADS